MGMLDGKRILITGGTGSLGKVLLKRILRGDEGVPAAVVILSRDEAKQYAVRMEYLNQLVTDDEQILQRFRQTVSFRIGDVRDFHSVSMALRDIDIVFNAAALKQVPSCEEFPYEAVLTNITAAQNIVMAIREQRLPVETVIGISTDKACKPVNVMGMTKAIQERIFVKANLECPETRFVCVRYGNVLASRGSVIPLFRQQIRKGGPVTITTSEMTRFLLSLEQAVDTVFAALREGQKGETYIPRVPATLITDLAAVLIEKRPIAVKEIGIRPGEKTHEILVSEEEVFRTIARGEYYVVLPNVAELRPQAAVDRALTKEYSSADHLMNRQELYQLLAQHDLLVEDDEGEAELLR